MEQIGSKKKAQTNIISGGTDQNLVWTKKLVAQKTNLFQFRCILYGQRLSLSFLTFADIFFNMLDHNSYKFAHYTTPHVQGIPIQQQHSTITFHTFRWVRILVICCKSRWFCNYLYFTAQKYWETGPSVVTIIRSQYFLELESFLLLSFSPTWAKNKQHWN
jgi:hypothetical protein